MDDVLNKTRNKNYDKKIPKDFQNLDDFLLKK